jgi:hypothetical protein
MKATLQCAVVLATVVTATAGGRAAAAQVEASPLVLDLRGATDSFGPGPVALSEAKVEFRLTRAAHVVLLWVAADGQVSLYWPLRSGDRSARRAGRQAISVEDVRAPVEAPVMAGAPTSSQPGRMAPTGGGMLAGRPDAAVGPAGYWVLLVADVPISAAEVRMRLGPMSHAGGGAAVLERLPEVLLVGRATLWAAYFAPVARR